MHTPQRWHISSSVNKRKDIYIYMFSATQVEGQQYLETVEPSSEAMGDSTRKVSECLSIFLRESCISAENPI